MAQQTVSNVPEIRFKAFTREWECSPLEKSCSLLTGNPFESKRFSQSGVFLVRGMNVKRGHIDNSMRISEYWPSTNGYEIFLLEEGDIVIQMDGALIGKSFARIDRTHLPALLVQRVARVRCENKAINDFLYQYIQRDFLGYIQNNKTETAVPHLSLNDIRNFPVAITSPAEQTRIGQYFKSLDRMIGLHQRKYDKLVTLKQAMLQKMFPQDGATTPEIRFKGFSEPWEVRALGKLASFSKGQGYSKSDLSKTGTPIVLYGRLYTDYQTEISKVNTFASEKKGSIKSKGKEVVVPSSGETSEDIARASAIIEEGVILGGDLNVIVPSDNLEPCFLALSLSNGPPQRKLAQKAQGKSVVHLRNSDLEPLDIPFPKSLEQQKIGNYFRNLDELISQHATQLEKLKNIKSACLEKMFV